MLLRRQSRFLSNRRLFFQLLDLADTDSAVREYGLDFQLSPHRFDEAAQGADVHGAPEFILELLAEGWTREDLLAEYPGLQEPDILACLAYAVETLKGQKVYPLAG